MNQENSPGKGRLQVIVNTANGSLPVADAQVTIYIIYKVYACCMEGLDSL